MERLVGAAQELLRRGGLSWVRMNGRLAGSNRQEHVRRRRRMEGGRIFPKGIVEEVGELIHIRRVPSLA